MSDVDTQQQQQQQSNQQQQNSQQQNSQQQNSQQQNSQQQQQQGPWWKSGDYGFDNDTAKFFEAKNYPDAKTALNSLRHADQIARERNVVAKPDPAKLTDWEGWEMLGWQKDPAKYVVPKPELKEGQVLDEAMFQQFTKDAHELRIPLNAAQELFKRQWDKANARITEMSTAGARSREELQTALKGEWGNNYDANVEASKRTMRALGIGMDDSAEIEKLIGSPRLVKLFHGLSSKIGEDTLVDGGTGGIRTPEAARAERLRLEADPDWIKVFNDPRNPRNKDFTAQRQRLIEIEAKK